eukprot:gene23151-26212_t
MGLYQSKSTEQKVKDQQAAHEKNNTEINDVRKIYWDSFGNLRVGNSDRNRDDEILNILKTDTNDEEDPTKLWMIVPSRWIRQWLLFAHIKAGPAPGPIDMWPLLKEDINEPGGWRPLKTLLPPCTEFGQERPGHYRRVSFEVWCALIDLYGVEGFAIAVRGIPYDTLTRWRVFKNPKSIDVRLLPEPELPEEPKKDEGVVGNLKTALFGGVGGLFGANSTNAAADLAKTK